MLTAAELNITDAEHRALRQVRELLAKQQIVHDATPSASDAQGRIFNMGFSGANAECGSIACIGGWMRILMAPTGTRASAEDMADYVHGYTASEIKRSESLHALFFPRALGDWGAITATQAVQAIDNFLTTGEPKWLETIHADS